MLEHDCQDLNLGGGWGEGGGARGVGGGGLVWGWDGGWVLTRGDHPLGFLCFL